MLGVCFFQICLGLIESNIGILSKTVLSPLNSTFEFILVSSYYFLNHKIQHLYFLFLGYYADTEAKCQVFHICITYSAATDAQAPASYAQPQAAPAPASYAQPQGAPAAPPAPQPNYEKGREARSRKIAKPFVKPSVRGF